MNPRLAAFLAPARIHPQSWRLPVGIVVFVALCAAALAALSFSLGTLVNFGLLSGETVDSLLAELQAGGGQISMLLYLFAFFTIVWLALWATLKLVHRRSLASVIGRAAPALADFWVGMVILFVVAGGLSLPLLWLMPPLEFTPDPGLWLWLLPLALLAVLIQTGAEEAVMRGWLLQELGLRFGRLVAILLPSAVFGFMHWGNGGDAVPGWMMVAATGLFGLIAADLTWRTGSIGLAWGLHFANNIIAILLFSSTPALDGMALYFVAEHDPALMQPLLLFDMALTGLVWLVCLLWLRRR